MKTGIAFFIALLFLAFSSSIKSQDAPNLLGLNVLGSEAIQINWFQLDTDGISGFRLYKSVDGNLEAFQDVMDPEAGVYMDADVDFAAGPIQYSIASLDSAGEAGELAEAHTTVFAAGEYVDCETSIDLSWSPYLGWDVDHYSVNLGLTEAAVLTADDESYTLDLSGEENGNICFTVTAWKNNITRSLSNEICVDYCGAPMTTGIETIGLNADFYPNPVHETLMVSITSNDQLNTQGLVKIYNVQGQQMLSRSIGNSVAIDVLNWENGMYLYFLENTDGQVLQSGTLIKQ